MNIASKIIKTYDLHTMGEPTRVIVDSIPLIYGKSMMEKKKYFKNNFDHIRTLLLHEPRGHINMFGAVITKSDHNDCDLGVIFMDSEGYLNMCGHGSIAVVILGIKLGLIEKKSKVILETPAGFIECEVTYKGENVDLVSINNVPAFVLESNVCISLESVGKIYLDIAFGGSIFGIVDVEQLGLTLNLLEQDKIVRLGTEIKDAINKQFKYKHPTKPDINTVDLIEFSKKINKNYYKNTVVFGKGQIDRSPCGTGTCAKLATLNLQLGDTLIQESIIGSKFTGKIIGRTRVGSFEAIQPQITGTAWLTGYHNFILEENDPYPKGFLIN